jgi:serine/threonine protein kinase
VTSELAAAARPSRAGEFIDDRYRLEAEIGAGGLGSVYRATQTKLARQVAVKLLHESWGASDVQRGRFEREAKALAALEHPNIVKVLDYGLSSGQPYLVMELLEGETLTQRLKQGALPLESALHIARQLLDALVFMHGAGLVHRDLKASNVFLQRTAAGERVKVLDFGLAKSTMPASGADATLTRDGTVVGTPAYMSPEQATGDVVDARSDVYAVGVLIFQMLSGRLPFEGDAIEQVRSHLVAPVPSLSRARPVRELDSALEKLIWRAMAKRREDRFATAEDMQHELSAIIRKHLPSSSFDLETLPSDLVKQLDSGALAGERPGLFARVRRFFHVTARVFSVLSMLFMVTTVSLLALLLRSDDDRADLLALERRVSQRLAKRVWPAHAPPVDPVIPAAVGGQAGSSNALALAAAADGGAGSPAADGGARAWVQPPAAVGGGGAPAAGSGGTPAQPLSAAGQAAPPPTASAKPGDFRVPGPPAPANPWSKPLPRELRAYHKQIFAGSAGNDKLILAINAYNDAHPDDARGHLLLAQLFMNRSWRPDAIAQLNYALKVDLAVRGAPEVLKNLLAITIHGKSAGEANRLIVRAYGSEALPMIDERIAASRNADASARLRALRARIQPGKP